MTLATVPVVKEPLTPDSSAMHLDNQLAVTVGHSCLPGVKTENDDCLGVRVPEGSLLMTKGIVAVIADGVSVAEKGREAAEICVQGFLNDYYDTPDSWTVSNSALKVLTSLNRWLFNLGRGYNNVYQGFITTLSVLVIKSNTAHVFHVGDSRVSLIREGTMEELTRDHAARLSDTDRRLTRAMGLDVNLEIDYRRVEIAVADVFCLSTDGMHENVPASTLLKVLNESADDLDAASEVINQTALENESQDNLSNLLLRVDNLSAISESEVYRQFSKLPFPPDLELGMILDGYKIVADVKASSRSQVYRVRDKVTSKQYIMKTPSVNYEDDTSYLERFAMESWIGKRIDSDHVVKAIRMPRKQAFLYNLFEFVEGPTLNKWVKINPNPEVKPVAKIVKEIIRGLRAMHRREMLHQDLKPDNIVIHPERGAVIIDLGSCYVGGIDEIDVAFQRDRILGTMHFSAPEYRLGRKPTEQADLFSLGMIMYYLFTGRTAYGEAFTKATTLRDFSLLEYESVQRYNPLVPAWVDGIIRKAVQVSPNLRYESFSELEYDLDHPNEDFLLTDSVPLLKKSSTKFWRRTAITLAITQIALLIWILLGR